MNHILDGNPISTFVVDVACKVTLWNRACHQLTGIAPADVIGTDKHRDIFYAHRREVLADLIARGASDSEVATLYKGKCRPSPLIQHGYEGEDFFPNLGRNGKWLFFTAAPVINEAGTITGAIETLQDISALRITERALNTSEAHYRQLFECANDAIFILENGAVSVCNQKALKLFQLTRKEMIGLTPLMQSPAVQPDGSISKDVIETKIAPALDDAPMVIEWRLFKKDGSTLDTEVSLTRFKVDATTRTLAIVRDITQRKKMMETVAAREKELEEQRHYLERVNHALKSALDHREVEKRAVEEHILTNLKRFVFPYLEALNQMRISADARAYVNIINTNLNEAISRLSNTMFAKYINFTPTEIRIADAIREGLNTKEIADLMGLAPSSVKWHRRNIRKKLGLTNSPLNLYTYLRALVE